MKTKLEATKNERKEERKKERKNEIMIRKKKKVTSLIGRKKPFEVAQFLQTEVFRGMFGPRALEISFELIKIVLFSISRFVRRMTSG